MPLEAVGLGVSPCPTPGKPELDRHLISSRSGSPVPHQHVLGTSMLDTVRTLCSDI